MMTIAKYFLFVTVLLFSCEDSIAQKVGIAFNVNYGNYNMNEIHQFQDELIESFPVKAKKMSSFPAFVGYDGRLFLAIKRMNVGIVGSFNSTGSRISYSDYSGSIAIDQLAKLKALGAFVEYTISDRSEKWEPFVSLMMLRGKSSYTLDARMKVGEEASDEQLDFESNHILLNPAFGIRRNVRSFYASATVGYVLDSSEDLRYEKDHKLRLLNEDNEPVGLDWSGFRLGLSIGVKF